MLALNTVEMLIIGLLVAILALQIYRLMVGMSRQELQDNLDDLGMVLSAMGEVFSNLDQLMPSYTIEANPIAGAIQKALLQWLGVDEGSLTGLELPRDNEGRFNGTPKEETTPPN